MAWDQVWINAKLITMQGDNYGLIENAAIAVKDDKITWLGEMDELKDSPANLAKEIHDAKGACITPGLIDCHTHLVFAGDRYKEFELRLEGATYEEIAKAGGGIRSTVKATRAASEDELFEQSLPRAKAMLAQGVTTIEIKSGYGLNLETEIKMLKVAKRIEKALSIDVSTTFLGAHALPEEFESNPGAYIDLVCEEMLPVIAKEKLASVVDAFCESIGFTPKQVERVFEKAKSLGLSVKLHAEQLSNLKGASLVAKYQGLSADHLEYVGRDSIEAMSKAGTVAVLLPGAFYFLRETKRPPIDLLRESNVPIGIATDCNPGSSPTTSLLLMLNMACTFWQMTPLEALQGVTVNAAKALGLQEGVGTLEAGKRADFVLWSIKDPAELAYWVGSNPCQQVIKSGKICT
jgi:imidazolonepropionase